MSGLYDPYEPGDRVYGMGKGDTKWEPAPLGTVVHRPEYEGSGSVFVQWDHSFVEDEMKPWDLRLEEGER